jgi:mannose-6-phosphate isomerase-like protein (cupin superfamily)
MLQPGDVLDLTPVGGRFIIRKTSQETDGKSFEMEWMLTPHAGGTPVHTHPNATETYEVLEGELDVYIAGVWKTLKAGDKAAAEPGVPHTFRNPTGEKARIYNTHQPALGYAGYFEKMAELVSLGIVDSDKISFKALLHLSILITSYPNEIHPIKPPAAVMRLLAAIGRMLGYGRVFSPKAAQQT